MRHLTDTELQILADQREKADAALEVHLNSCRLCQDRLKNYRAMFSTLSEDGGMLLPADFAETVMQRIEGKTSDAFDWQENSLMIVSGASSLAAAGYFLEAKNMLPAEWTVALQEFWAGLSLSMPDVQVPTTIIFAVIVLMLTAFSEKLLPKRNLQT